MDDAPPTPQTGASAGTLPRGLPSSPPPATPQLVPAFPVLPAAIYGIVLLPGFGWKVAGAAGALLALVARVLPVPSFLMRLVANLRPVAFGLAVLPGAFLWPYAEGLGQSFYRAGLVAWALCSFAGVRHGARGSAPLPPLVGAFLGGAFGGFVFAMAGAICGGAVARTATKRTAPVQCALTGALLGLLLCAPEPQDLPFSPVVARRTHLQWAQAFNADVARSLIAPEPYEFVDESAASHEDAMDSAADDLATLNPVYRAACAALGACVGYMLGGLGAFRPVRSWRELEAAWKCRGLEETQTG